jgi:hypothetical protein
MQKEPQEHTHTLSIVVIGVAVVEDVPPSMLNNRVDFD